MSCDNIVVVRRGRGQSDGGDERCLGIAVEVGYSVGNASVSIEPVDRQVVRLWKSLPAFNMFPSTGPTFRFKINRLANLLGIVEGGSGTAGEKTCDLVGVGRDTE
ncbi:hypothetical protein AAG570_014087 [Ranatra chinensis]|uniref:Uncharacterized protein n=1 Tax=Ranatra chinensis TaxID=642074 RepID=A0ABD0Y7G1_9HEMI